MQSTTAWLSLRRSGEADMYLQHFGLRHPPLGKNLTQPLNPPRYPNQPSSSRIIRTAVSLTTPSPKLPPTGLNTSR